MKMELISAANFLAHLIRIKSRPPFVNEQQLMLFRNSLINSLYCKYREHWFPKKPYKDAHYRCIRNINNKIDPIIIQSGQACGISLEILNTVFYYTLVLWIDPLEVSYRIGQNGNICILYTFENLLPWSSGVTFLSVKSLAIPNLLVRSHKCSESMCVS